MTDNKKYPPLQAHKHSLNSGSFDPLYTADQMRAYVDADRPEWSNLYDRADALDDVKG